MLVGLAVLKIGLTCGVAWVSYRYLELPLLRRSSVHGHGRASATGRDPAEQQQDFAKAA